MAGPHQDQPLVTAGANPEDADAGAVMVHGRGASAQGILGMAGQFDVDGVAYVAPQARRGEWYPNSFMAPVDSNEPGLSSGLRAVEDAMATLNDAGIPTERVLLAGFSQGACLASEFVARNARRYGGLAAFSGGVIGPEGTPRDYGGSRASGERESRQPTSAGGSLDGTPVFVGCSDRDPHIPLERVHETTEVFEDLDGDVTERIYEGMGHTVNEDEIEFVADMLSDLVDD